MVSIGVSDLRAEFMICSLNGDAKVLLCGLWPCAGGTGSTKGLSTNKFLKQTVCGFGDATDPTTAITDSAGGAICLTT
jgi:hypothetical protein